jgi:hypothetical protein
MTVWSFDPGVVSGYAFMDDFIITKVGVFLDIHAELVFTHIKRGDIVLYETLHCTSAFNPTGFEVIGVLKYFCRKRNIVAVARSPRELRGPYLWPALDTVRKQIKSVHVRDAIYHLAAWCSEIHHVIPTVKEDLHED